MKMRKLLFIAICLFSIISLTSCNPFVGEGGNSYDIFRMKKECAAMKEKVFIPDSEQIELDEFFYSPSYNTCLYSLRIINDSDERESIMIYHILDALRDELIMDFRGCGLKINCAMNIAEMEEEYIKWIENND